MRRLLLASAAIGAVALLAGSPLPPVPRSSGPLRHEAYVWQRSWGRDVATVVGRQAPEFARLVLLGAEISWRENGPRVAWSDTDFAAALAADRGALELSRGRFSESLAALLDGRSWIDAAFVAERVLTTDELAAFVAARYPSADGDETEWDYYGQVHAAPGVVIHGLLARRLAREGRWSEAFPHFGPELRSKAERFALRLAEGRDAAHDRDYRANALRDAARILRADGMDLVGTETAPDWRAFGGNYELRDVATQRPSVGIAPATPQERERAERSRAQPQRRFHYRYVAADIAWDAALLMPDETPVTAAWLREAGMWLAARDPKAADRFYKAMVLRCGTTELGKAAAAAKWFPK